jgi:phosphate-selective porin OprO and OprP
MNIRRNLTLIASLSLGVGSALTVMAQPQPEPAPETPPPPDQPSDDQLPAEEPSAPDAQVEQTPGAPDTTTPRDAPKPSASVTADEKGFALKAAGDPSPFVLKLRLVAQLDARKYFDELNTNDTMAPRRLRPYLDGTVLGLVDYRLLVDFAGSQAVVMDAYADVHPYPWLRFRYGKFKTPIGLERLQSDPDLPFVERAMTSALTPDRDVGLQIWGDVAGGVVSYAVGVFNGASDSSNLDSDNGKDKDFAGRIVLQPFKVKSLESLGQLGLAVAGTYGKRNGKATATGLAPFRTVGRLPLFTYLAPAATAPDAATTTAFAEGDHTRINPELYYYIGGLGLVAEAVWSTQEIHLGGFQRDLTHVAWHATLSYVIGGKNGLDGATPSSPFDPSQGQLGALEIGARYHTLELDEDTFPIYANPVQSAQKAQGFGVSLNWTWSRTFRLMANFEHTEFEGGAGTAATADTAAEVEDRAPENVILARAQVVF